MANITELLAKSLDVLKEIQKDDDFMVVKSSDLSPVHLKRLVANNFLYPISATILGVKAEVVISPL